MTPVLDLVYVTLFAVVAPVMDYLVFWRAFRRRADADPARVRVWLWTWTIVWAWAVVAIGLALWIASGRPWALLGLTLPKGWRLGASIALLLLLAAYLAYSIATVARNAEARNSVRRQLDTFTNVLPHTRKELCWFATISLTAGFCEEFLFRGFYIRALAPWLGWWGAAAVSVVIFAIGHAYQGKSGVLRTGVVGILFTLVVALFGSLWPAIALHALLDLGQGGVAYLALTHAEPAAQRPGDDATAASPAS